MTPVDPVPRLRVLHLILVLRATNSQYNEHSLPVMEQREISICSFFPSELEVPPEIEVHQGDGTVGGFVRLLRRVIAEGSYDVIHAHSPHTGALLAAVMFVRPRLAIRERSVFTVHDSFHDFKLRNKLLLLPTFASMRRVVFCSESARGSVPRWAARLLGDRDRVVRNGVDLDRLDRSVSTPVDRAPGSFQLVSVGRLEPVKDPLALVEMMANLPDDMCLTIVGAGSMRAELEEAIASRGLGARITLSGLVPREEVYRHLASADAYVSSSLGEGLPIAVMEAMAHEIPVVASDIEPHRELGGPPGAFALVPMGDAVGLARAVRELAERSPASRRELGAGNRSVVTERFGLEQMTAGYDAVYAEVVPGFATVVS
ncbi:MAG: glycosyltransferase family 4 protein [Acidimicrobiales bacterium]